MKGMSASKTQLPVSDLTELLKPYSSGWVALSSDQRQVVGAGERLQEAHDQALEHSIPNAIFIKVIPPDQGYLPLFL